MDDKQECDALESARVELVQRLSRRTKKSCCLATAIPGVTLAKYDHTTEPKSYLRGPSLCILVQGAKKFILGDGEYICDANQYLVTSVSLPVISEVTAASKEVPLLGVGMQLDVRMLTQLVVESIIPVRRECHCELGIAVSKVTAPFLRAINRLLELLDTPADIPILAPLFQKEILYRLLTGGKGAQLCKIAMAGNYSHQIARAIEWMRNNFTKPFRVEDVASEAGMSTSAFHLHFRSVTSMSPLQFQKWIRLHEARRIMIIEHQGALRAACRVGYESPSQFNREYRRLFGEPPLRDIKKLQKNEDGQENTTGRSLFQVPVFSLMKGARAFLKKHRMELLFYVEA